MAAFEYQALDADGKTLKGVLEADTARGARATLRERGLSPLEVEPLRERTGAAEPPWSRSRLSTAELALLSRELATLVEAGLPMDEALAALADQSQTPRIGKIVAALRSKVLEGEPLAQALAAFPGSFPELFRAGVAAGEASGQLGVALTRLADHSERRAELGRALLGALAYPLLLMVVAIAVVSGLLVYVVPQIVHVFEHVGQKLPLLTRMLLALSAFARSWGLVVIALGVAAAFGIRASLKRESVRERIDRTLLKLPLFGRLLRAADAARVTQTLATLSASGVPLLDALRHAVGSARLAPMRNALRAAALRVREGQGFARALAESGQFPPVALRLIASGEKSGRLDTMLDAAAEHEQHEVSTRVGALTAVLGPLVILFVGGLVLLIVLAILLPIFELNSLIK